MVLAFQILAVYLQTNTIGIIAMIGPTEMILSPSFIPALIAGSLLTFFT
jgi:hypothetical protein